MSLITCAYCDVPWGKPLWKQVGTLLGKPVWRCHACDGDQLWTPWPFRVGKSIIPVYRHVQYFPGFKAAYEFVTKHDAWFIFHPDAKPTEFQYPPQMATLVEERREHERVLKLKAQANVARALDQSFEWISSKDQALATEMIRRQHAYYGFMGEFIESALRYLRDTKADAFRELNRDEQAIAVAYWAVVQLVFQLPENLNPPESKSAIDFAIELMNIAPTMLDVLHSWLEAVPAITDQAMHFELVVSRHQVIEDVVHAFPPGSLPA